MPDKKQVFEVAKGSPAVGIPLMVAKVGQKAQEAHTRFAAKQFHPVTAVQALPLPHPAAETPERA